MSEAEAKEIIENMSNEELNEYVFFIAQTMSEKYDGLLLDIQNIIKQLKRDEENITKKYKESKNINCYLSAYDRIRIRAYRTKTKEIRERLEKVINNQMIYRKGDTNE